MRPRIEDKTYLQQQLHLLLTAYGYNLYNAENRARADDQLVRQRACESLGQACAAVSRIASEYHDRFIPPSTREEPFPPADKIARLKHIRMIGDEISGLESRIRGASVPTQDRTWAKFRTEENNLIRLLDFDYRLITAADAMRDVIEPLTADEWSDTHVSEIRTHIHEINELAREREQMLATPF